MNNKYSVTSVPTGVPTIINSLTVPARSGYSLKGAIIWSDVDAEITVNFNLDTIGGGRINGAAQTLFLDFSSSPYGLNSFDSIVTLAYQESGINHDFKSTLLIEQL